MKHLPLLLTLLYLAVFSTAVTASEIPWNPRSHTEVGVTLISTANLGLEEGFAPGAYLQKQVGLGTKAAFLIEVSARDAPKVETDGEGTRSAVAIEFKFALGRGVLFNLGAQVSRTKTPDWSKDSFVPYVRVGYTWGLNLIELRGTDRDSTENESQSFGLIYSRAIPGNRLTYIWTISYSLVEYDQSGERQNGNSLQLGLGARF